MQKPGVMAGKFMLEGIRLIRRPIAVSVLGVVGTLAFVGYQLANAQETFDAWSLSQGIHRGKKTAPVPLNLKGKNPDLVYLGSYIVNAQGGCNQCHTCPSFKPGLDPYKIGGKALGSTDPTNTVNYLAGGTPFPNSIVSPNLTPDSSGNPGGLTFNEFATAMQDGELPTGHILQVMPWPVFRNMDVQKDIRAIYEYLSAIPPALPGKCTAPASDK
jgi:hypothetical protein